MSATEKLTSLADERVVLAGAFRDHAALMLVRPSDFTSEAHRAICGAAQKAVTDGGRVTRETVRIELGRRGESQHIDIAMQLAKEIPDLDGLPQVAARLRELAGAREAHRHASEALRCLERGDIDDAKDAIAMLGETNDRHSLVRSRSFGELAEDLVRSWEHGPRNLAPVGVPTIDRHIGGLERDGSLCVFGARTHVGKSYFALTCVDGLLDAGEKPGVVTAEDPARLWAARAIAAKAHIPADRLRRGDVSEDDKQAARAAAADWKKRGGELVPAVGAPIDRVVAAMAHLVREKGCTVLLVDYLQAIACEGKDPRQQTDRKLAMMKSAAARLGVPWILFSQLRRPDEVAKLWTEPHISELKESGEIENRAEAILLGWRPRPTSHEHEWNIGLYTTSCGVCRLPWRDEFRTKAPLCHPPLAVRVAKAKGEPAAGSLAIMLRGPGWLWEPAPDDEARAWREKLDAKEQPRSTGRSNGQRASRQGALPEPAPMPEAR